MTEQTNDKPAAEKAAEASKAAPAQKSAAKKPAAKKPAAKKAAAPSVTVKGPEKGRRRIGRHFGAEKVTIPLSALKKGELEALEADPELVVVTTGDADDD